MTISFKHNRLLVGYRIRDFSPIWCEPSPVVDPDDSSLPVLFSVANGEGGNREPQRGEVAWLPFFDLKRCESDTAKEKTTLQQQFLSDAWKYCAETDPDILKMMEEEMDHPDWPRWNEWFKEAKKWKRQKLGVVERRNRRRRATGEEEDGVGEDSEDSAYQSGDQMLQRKEGQSQRDSPSLFLPEKAKGKRRAKGRKEMTDSVRAKKAKFRSGDSAKAGPSSSIDRNYDADGDNDLSSNAGRGGLPTPLATQMQPPPGRGLSKEIGKRPTSSLFYQPYVETDYEDDGHLPGPNGGPAYPDRQRLSFMANINGTGLSEEEALRRAVRDSMAPENRRAALGEASEEVRPTIEGTPGAPIDVGSSDDEMDD